MHLRYSSAPLVLLHCPEFYGIIVWRINFPLKMYGTVQLKLHRESVELSEIVQVSVHACSFSLGNVQLE